MNDEEKEQRDEEQERQWALGFAAANSAILLQCARI